MRSIRFRRTATVLALSVTAAITPVAIATATPDAGKTTTGHAVTTGLSAREAVNAAAATDFIVGSFTKHEPRKYALKHVDPDTYIQHNPNFANGRDAFISGVEHMVAQLPDSLVTVKRTVTQGDLVVVQTLFQVNRDDRGTAVVDTFRFNRQGRIVEHWDVLQEVAAQSVNGNPQI